MQQDSSNTGYTCLQTVFPGALGAPHTLKSANKAAAQHGGATTQRLPAHGAGASSQVHKRRQHRLSTSPCQQHPQITSSGGIRTHTPDLEDVPSAVLRKRVRRTTVFAPVPDSTATALQPPAQQPSMAAQDKSLAETATAAEAVPAALQGTAWTSLQPPPSTPNALAPARAQPFSLGVMWDAYHNNPTEDMAGYPHGFWASEPSPFAALASVPLQEDESSCNNIAMPQMMPSTSSSW